MKYVRDVMNMDWIDPQKVEALFKILDSFIPNRYTPKSGAKQLK